MEVTIQSTLPSVSGQVTVSAEPEAHVDTLIINFCIQKGIQVEKDFVIRNQNQEILPPTRRIAACNVKDGDILILGSKGANNGYPMGCNQWWLLAGVALLIGGVGVVATTLIRSNSLKDPEEYGVVIDAGSTHTRIFVFKWDGQKENGTALASQVYSCNTKGGISSFAGNPEEAGRSFEECLKNATAAVPSGDHYTTPVFLGATAGMRLLKLSNATAAAAVMQSVRKTLSSSPFAFVNKTSQARILDGADEGAFGWVTNNYLSGNLTVSTSQYLYDTLFAASPLPSYGALDMGGASTQITFVPESPSDIPDGYSDHLLMYGRDYQVYTHSYLCYGAKEAKRKLMAYLVTSQGNKTKVKNPCIPNGNVTTDTHSEIFEVPCTKNLYKAPDADEDTTYSFIGTSDSAACHSAVQHLFDFNQTCGFPGNCAFNGAYQPPVHGKYMAFSGYFYLMHFLNLTSSAHPSSLKEFRNKTTEYCSKTWNEVSVIPVEDPNYLLDYCFNANYIDTILTKGYKFNESTWTDISFVIQVSNSEVGWALGFMLNVSNRIPAQYPTPSVSTPLFVLLLALFSVFIALSVGFACHARNQGKQTNKPYVRMVPDYGTV